MERGGKAVIKVGIERGGKGKKEGGKEKEGEKRVRRATLPRLRRKTKAPYRKDRAPGVPPTGIEPISPEPESAILSIELQGRFCFRLQRCNIFTVNANFAPGKKRWRPFPPLSGNVPGESDEKRYRFINKDITIFDPNKPPFSEISFIFARIGGNGKPVSTL